MPVTLSHLRAVEALARTGQFSRAAQLLGLSQPTISTQVQAFEAMSAVRVFIRDGHSVRIAPGAEALIGKIRIALRAVEEIERDISDTQQAGGGRISIGFSAHRLIMPVLSAFVGRFPHMQVVTRGGPSMELADAVHKGELDVAAISQVGDDPRFANHLLRRCRVIIYGQKGHPLLAKGSLSIGDLDNQNMILWNRASGTRTVVERLSHQAGITLRAVLEVATLDVAYAAAASGLGLAVAIQGEVLPDDDIDIAVVEDDGAEIGHYLVAQPETVHYAAIAAFLDIAKSLTGESAGRVPR
ncbi:LysR substrate-binding domain-containing protein [Segnochrobactrum spirostomi]|uniref:LysR family transcriptional regulator n=1 Tax=Segnochrobactrum spirostomi TaxID=2608987 RepID=A0A6A7Y4D6_9HYPH|nr:LysR family transcriptional regulator [Segnochrobactrum spirostomi]MQT12569.1 LysR family transcriptional regulator [Segnochrobactrum spirostomi]